MFLRHSQQQQYRLMLQAILTPTLRKPLFQLTLGMLRQVTGRLILHPTELPPQRHCSRCKAALIVGFLEVVRGLLILFTFKCELP